jgi:transcriptional regulator with XRE-family HTH domain
MATSIAEQVAKRIRELREARSWSQEALAEATGLSRDAIFRIERGDRSPGLETLAAIAAGLAVSLPELLDFGRAPSRRAKGAAGRGLDSALRQAEPWLADALGRAVRLIVAAGVRAAKPRRSQKRRQ